MRQPSDTGTTRRVDRGWVLAAGVPLLASAVLGVVAGVVWWVVAPTAEVVVVRGLVVAPDAPELEAAQDVTFVVIVMVAGLLGGGWLAAAPGALPSLRALGVVAGGVVGSAVAWGTGALLGPSSVAAQQAAGADPLQSPVALSAYGVLGLWPAVAATVGFAGLLTTGLLGGWQQR